MRRVLPILFSFFFIFTALVETTHVHAQAADAPCPVVCLSNCCGAYYADPALKCYITPADTASPAIFSFETVFIHRLAEDDIFHPPAV